MHRDFIECVDHHNVHFVALRGLGGHDIFQRNDRSVSVSSNLSLEWLVIFKWFPSLADSSGVGTSMNSGGSYESSPFPEAILLAGMTVVCVENHIDYNSPGHLKVYQGDILEGWFFYQLSHTIFHSSLEMS